MQVLTAVHFVSCHQAYFYVTDSGTYRNRLFYYRKPTWAAVEKMALHGKKINTLYFSSLIWNFKVNII